jgi:acetyl-CoA synthetase
MLDQEDKAVEINLQGKSLQELRTKSLENIEEFWAQQADNLIWSKKWDKTLDWNPPFAKWFTGGLLNASVNCLDKHINNITKNKAAIIWENESDDVRTLTYNQLYVEVNKFANALRNLGVKKGDRVTIYLPMVPELPVAMLACSRIGAIHIVVFSGFSSQALTDRINDSKSKVIITADQGVRRGKILELKKIVDSAITSAPSIENVIVLKRGTTGIKMNEKDLLWHELVKKEKSYCPPELVESTHPLYILYTSGTTGKPKGVLHSTGGYLTHLHATAKWVFDYKEEDIFLCTADIGWVTGHSYMVYAPLLHGVTNVIYEGTPDFPTPDRYWALVEKHRATILYTTPTALRIYMKYDLSIPNSFDLSSLRLLGTVGEAINPDVWLWYFRTIGNEKCPIVDTWWQTETGGIMISQCLGIDTIAMKPGSATFPIPGVDIGIVDENGIDVNPDNKGYLVIKRPWPGMLMTLWNNDDKYINTYWNKFQGFYYSGDFALIDPDNYIWLLGRSDDVLKIAGHRLGTMELESAFVAFKAIAEAAVISKPDKEKGEAIVAFLVLKSGYIDSPELKTDLVNHIRKTVGPIATPNEIHFTNKLPKTRSGKIMRRLLKSISTNSDVIGDTSTLEDEASIEEIKQIYQDFQDISK